MKAYLFLALIYIRIGVAIANMKVNHYGRDKTDILIIFLWPIAIIANMVRNYF